MTRAGPPPEVSTASAPLKIGLFAHLVEPRPALEEVLQEFLDLFVLAEQLGVGSAWVRQFHLAHPAAGRPGGLASPFVFLGVLAARTSSLRLGTAAITLPLEQPLRVAEDAAVLDALSGGRVELGLANGGTPPAAAAFGVTVPDSAQQRRRAYLDAAAAVLGALRGDPVTDDGQVIAPARPGLADRVWHATLSDSSAAEAAALGHGVLVGTTQVVPAEVSVAAYHRALPAGAVPRVGLSTWVFPGRTRAEALRRAEPGLRAKWEWAKDFLPRADTVEEIAERLTLHHGSPDDIAESIAGHPAFGGTTQLQLQLDGLFDHPQERRAALSLFLAEVAPQLGWQPEHVTEGEAA